MAFLGLQLGPNVQFDPGTTGLANLSLAQWQQGMSQFYPVENQLINYAESPATIAQARAQAQSGAAQAFAAQQAAQGRQLGLMGVTPTAAQQAALSKQSALAGAAAQAGAVNQATRGAYNNQMAALSGG